MAEEKLEVYHLHDEDGGPGVLNIVAKEDKLTFYMGNGHHAEDRVLVNIDFETAKEIGKFLDTHSNDEKEAEMFHRETPEPPMTKLYNLVLTKDELYFVHMATAFGHCTVMMDMTTAMFCAQQLRASYRHFSVDRFKIFIDKMNRMAKAVFPNNVFGG